METKEIVKHANSKSNPLKGPSASKNNSGQTLRLKMAKDFMGDGDYQFSDFMIGDFNSHYWCRLCSFKMSHKDAFSRHIVEDHPEVERYKCKFCIKEFLHVYKCMNHIRDSHYPQLALEMKKYKIDIQTKDVYLLYGNCYTIIPSKALVVYAKGNQVIGYNEKSEELNVEVTEVKLEGESEMGATSEVCQGKFAKLVKGRNYQITDGEGNSYFVNSDGAIELITEDNYRDLISPDSSLDNENPNDSVKEKVNVPSSSSKTFNPPSTAPLPKPKIESKIECSLKQERNPRKAKKAATKPDRSKKPKFSYGQLIYLAIKNSKNKSQSIDEMCSFIVNHFPYFRKPVYDKKLRAGIRRTLCGHRCFARLSIQEDSDNEVGKRAPNCWTYSSDQQALSKLKEAIESILTCNPSLKQFYQTPGIF